MKTNRSLFKERPRNKANMDQPQEEFTQPSGTHAAQEPAAPARLLRGPGRRTAQNTLRAAE